jgi:hypothetical protein
MYELAGSGPLCDGIVGWHSLRAVLGSFSAFVQLVMIVELDELADGHVESTVNTIHQNAEIVLLEILEAGRCVYVSVQFR